MVSTGSQIILLRELLVGFSGNELSISMTFAFWMLAVGFGAAAGMRRAASFAPFLSAVLLPLSFAFARTWRGFAASVPFEMPGLGAMVWVSAVTLLPVCFIFGAWFQMCAAASGNPPRVYFFESAGAVTGALLTGLLLIPFAGGVNSVLAFAALCVIGQPVKSRQAGRTWRKALAAVPAALLVVAIAGGFTAKAEKFTSQLRFKPFILEESLDTVYGNVSVVRSGNALSFYESGARVASTADSRYAEEVSYFAMLSGGGSPRRRIGSRKPGVGRALLIGSSLAGIPAELMKYGCDELVVVELDPVLVRLGEKYGAAGAGRGGAPGVKRVFEDGRRYLRRAAARGESFDRIIVCLPDPVSGLVNRFYTLGFFREAKRALYPGGVLLTSLSAPDSYVSKELGVLSVSIHNTLACVFGKVLIIPGERDYFIASDSPLKSDAVYFIESASRAGVKPVYLTPFHVRYMLSAERAGGIRHDIFAAGTASAQVNTDAMPVSYFYGLIYWASGASGPLKKMLSATADSADWLRGLAVPAVVIVSALAMAFLLIRIRRSGTGDRVAVLLAVGLIGFSSMLLELAVILAFQSVHGYVYSHISFLIGAFMAGLAIGATRRVSQMPHAAFYLSVLIAPVSLTLPLFFRLYTPVSAWLLLMFVLGVPVGAVFASASRQSTGSAGFFYGADLWGAAAAAFAGSVFLFPVLGVSLACIAAAAAAAVASIAFVGVRS
jgi:spermidine synthase